MAKERTFIAVKPDGVQRGLTGEIIQRFEKKGFKLVAMKFMQGSEEHLKQHYADLSSKPFFAGLVKYMASAPVVAMCWEGTDVVKTARKMMGETKPADSAIGTIRGDFCIEVGRNIIHGSDSVESAEKEIKLWFKPEELVDWKHCAEGWVYEFLIDSNRLITSETDLRSLNSFLQNKSYIGGYQASYLDLKVSRNIRIVLDFKSFPHVCRWFKHIKEIACDIVDRLYRYDANFQSCLENSREKSSYSNITNETREFSTNLEVESLISVQQSSNLLPIENECFGKYLNTCENDLTAAKLPVTPSKTAKVGENKIEKCARNKKLKSDLRNLEIQMKFDEKNLHGDISGLELPSSSISVGLLDDVSVTEVSDNSPVLQEPKKEFLHPRKVLQNSGCKFQEPSEAVNEIKVEFISNFSGIPAEVNRIPENTHNLNKLENKSLYTDSKSLKSEVEVEKSSLQRYVSHYSIVLEVKPKKNYSKSDLMELDKIIKTIKMDGLTWGNSQVKPSFYGSQNLSIICELHDDKNSIQDVILTVLRLDTYVEDVDVTAFSKI